MRPIKHLILGIVLAPLIFLVYPKINLFGFVIIILSSILIDIDHYFYYICKKKEINPLKAYKWYILNGKKCCLLTKEQKKEISFGFSFLHGLEILVLLYILYIRFSQIFIYIFIGVAFHLFLDLISEAIKCGRINKISIIYSFFKNKRLKFIDDF